ncbi:Ketoisovalerate oxidoreductase subunit VorD [uncultured archaeon]|nr:Ketoisovalerate oxidoreductase subunit VorD [uncultured archaeon]
MIIPYAKPGTSTRTMTGEWKAFMPVVDEKRCIKCAICQSLCPEGIMGEPKKVPEIDYDYCKGCSICANECPVKCIEMNRAGEKAGALEAKGKGGKK